MLIANPRLRAVSLSGYESGDHADIARALARLPLLEALWLQRWGGRAFAQQQRFFQ